MWRFRRHPPAGPFFIEAPLRYSCSMPKMSPRVEELRSKVKSRGSNAALAAKMKKEILGMSAEPEEFYNHNHDRATGQFSGRAAQGRAGFREGSHSPAVAAARHSVGARGSGGRVATTNVAKKNWAVSDPPGWAGKVWTYGPGRKTKSGGKGDVREENFVRGDGRKGPVHSKTKLHQGTVYTALKGSHSIRKTKSGGYVVHRKHTAPEKITKRTADHIKMLDDHKPTAAEDVMGRIARWKAKG